MKYWNKTKKYRLLHWTKVDIPNTLLRIQDLSNRHCIIKQWCQQQTSTGKFYFKHGPYIWFEKGEDATWFILKWT